MVVSYEVTIRAGVTVTNKDRLLWGSKTLMVDTVTPTERTARSCCAVLRRRHRWHGDAAATGCRSAYRRT